MDCIKPLSGISEGQWASPATTVQNHRASQNQTFYLGADIQLRLNGNCDRYGREFRVEVRLPDFSYLGNSGKLVGLYTVRR
jgi:hypothetical protein